jgi:hypothetical protein
MSCNYYVQGRLVLERLLNGGVKFIAECASPEAAQEYIRLAVEQAQYANFCEEEEY